MLEFKNSFVQVANEGIQRKKKEALKSQMCYNTLLAPVRLAQGFPAMQEKPKLDGVLCKYAKRFHFILESLKPVQTA